MAEIKPEIEGTNIVFLGDFNPKIFQPAWFAAQNLIRNEEAENANVVAIHEAIMQFSLDWLNVQVQQDRFSAAAHQSPYFEILRDLIIGTFRILSHTPIKKMGINYDAHFPKESEEAWHAVGDRYAPKDVWNLILKKPGMLSLNMQGERSDDFKGVMRVRLEPSRRITHGVYVNVNDHYEVKDRENSLGCAEIIDILESVWTESISRAKKIAQTLLEER